MLKKRYSGPILLLACSLALCQCIAQKEYPTAKKRPSTKNILYSFFVAGHTYGDHIPIPPYEGLDPDFKAKFDFIRKYPGMQFGVLTGDMVANPYDRLRGWDAFDKDIGELRLPVHKALGNHDVGIGPGPKRELFLKRYGKTKTYYKFQFKKDLFIILDSTLNNLSIVNQQLRFLSSALKKENIANIDNVFVFFHHVLWWEKLSESYGSFPINQPQKTRNNFFSELMPLFQNTGRSVYIFAGDVGAWGSVCHYHKIKNVHLMANGMGNSKKDNILMIAVDRNKDVFLDLIALNGDDPYAMGSITKYSLEYVVKNFTGPNCVKLGWKGVFSHWKCTKQYLRWKLGIEKEE